MPDIKIPNIDVEKAAAEFNTAVKEAAYVAVGLGVLGFQRAQVQRVELTKQLEAQLSGLSSLSNNLSEQAEAYITSAREQLAELRAQLSRISTDLIPSDLVPANLLAGERRPDPAAVRAQLTELAKSVDEAVAPVRKQFDEQLDRLEVALPEAARNLVQSVRSAAGTQEQALRSAVGLA